MACCRVVERQAVPRAYLFRKVHGMRIRPPAQQWLLVLIVSAAALAGGASTAAAGELNSPEPVSWRQFALDSIDRIGLGRERREYGLHFDDDISLAAPAGRLVVVVHGFHSDRWHVTEISACVRTSGLPHAVFEYPNDQAVSESAGLLSAELARLKRSAPQCQVTLVTHSMGGLVAREAIENPRLDSGNVNRVIMIAPPNHGSRLADCNCPLVDAWEYWHSSERRKKAGLIYGAIEDGLGEAAKDLRPESPFLTQLNARPRNPRVRYSILLGNRAPLASKKINSPTAETSTCRWTMSWMAKGWYEDLDEVVNGSGDGVVALSSGRLEGVRDVAVFPFDHIGVLKQPGFGTVNDVHRAILARLK